MLFDDPANLDPDKILEWLSICSHGLNLTRKSVIAALPFGTLPRGILADALVGRSAREIDEHFDECQIELDLFTVLTLITSAEAKIRIDANKRRITLGNPLSERLSIQFKNAKSLWSVPLYEGGILEEWKSYIRKVLNLPSVECVRMINDIGVFKDLITLRNWVAHGRYWKLARHVNSYPPSSVADAIDRLYEVLAKAARHGNLHPFR